jgi:Fic family protein
LDLTQPELIRLLARAQALADAIRHVPLSPRTQEKFHRLNILRAVRGTTCIEGAELSETEVEAVVGTPQEQHVLPPSRQVEETEARNAYEVMQFIASTVKAKPDTPVSEELIRELHRHMTRDIPDPHNQPGEYRLRAVRVDRYRPPPPEQVPTLMRQFVEWFNQEPQVNWDRVVRAVVAHFYVVSIHPFADGNGRTGRAVESFLLYQAGVNVRGFYSLANYYYRLRTDYFRHLDQARSTPETDLTPLILFAARGLVEELEGMCKEVLAQVRLIAFRDYARGVLARAKSLRAANRSRLQRLLLGLLDLQTQGNVSGIPLAQLRAGEGLLAALYEEKSPATLTRDLKFLTQHRLVVVDQGRVRANLELMSEFTS